MEINLDITTVLAEVSENNADVVVDVSTVQAELALAGIQGAPGATGATGATGAPGAPGANGIGAALPMVSNFYYTAPASNSVNTANLNRTFYIPIFVTENTTFDRIAVRTSGTFSGSGVARLGIYANSGGQPGAVVLDAGTVATTAANTTYEITINQTLSAGIYWLAMCSQTNATTNSYRSATTPYYQAHFVNTLASAAAAVGWYEDGVTGTFNTAGSLVSASSPIATYIRKA